MACQWNWVKRYMTSQFCSVMIDRLDCGYIPCINMQPGRNVAIVSVGVARADLLHSLMAFKTGVAQ